MARVKLTNELYPFLQLTLATHDLSKGHRFVNLKKGESVEVDDKEFSDQVKGLLKRKRLTSLVLDLPKPTKVVPTAPPEEVVAEKKKKDKLVSAPEATLLQDAKNQ